MVRHGTRLEFLIVTISFVILLLCSRPPQPGAAVTLEPEVSNLKSQVSNPSPPAGTVAPAPEAPTAQASPAPVGLPQPEPPQAPKPATRRMATVDARNCPGLNYPEIMYGEVTVRWIWNGDKLVPRKVCLVREPGGATTVWSFDEPGDAVVTEIGEMPIEEP